MVVVETLEYVNVYATDLKKSVEFYTLFLDFELLEENDSYAIVTFDELKVKLVHVESAQKEDDTRLPILSFILDVDDFTEAIQMAEEEKIPIISGPDDFESGAGESILLKDPGGNIVEFFYRE